MGGEGLFGGCIRFRLFLLRVRLVSLWGNFKQYFFYIGFFHNEGTIILTPATFCQELFQYSRIIISQIFLQNRRIIIAQMIGSPLQNKNKIKSNDSNPTNNIEKVRSKLQQKKHQLQMLTQKIQLEVKTQNQLQKQKRKKDRILRQFACQKKVNTLNDQNKNPSYSNENEEISYFKSKDNYLFDKQFLITPLSTAVFYPPSCSAYDLAYCKGNDCVYAYGGISCTSQLEEGLKQYFYRLEDGIWKEIKPVSMYTPMPRYGHTITGTNDSLLLFGGVSEYKQKLKDRCFYPDVWSFNTQKNNWKVLQFTGPLLKNRKSHAACVYGKYYIVCGGIDDSQEVICDLSWVNIQQRKSRWRNKHIQGRFNHQITVHESQHSRDYLFIFGGRNSQSQIIGQLTIYPIYISQGELHFRQPLKLNPQLTPCQFPIMRNIDNGILIMGGIDENNEAVNQCWYYNPDKQNLTGIENGIDWNQLRGAKGISINGRSVYILAGSNSKKYKAIRISVVQAEEQFKHKI